MTELTDNIKELALIVRKAKASVFVMECISSLEPDDINSDDIELRFEVDGRDTGTNVSIVDECGQAAKSICSLVEALEKAQRANSTQDDHINQQQDSIDKLEKGHGEAAKQINSWRRLAKQNIAEREKDINELEAARQRIAELEAQVEQLKAVNAAAEKLVRCKGRYHSEQNYRALAALFGVNTPDLAPLDSEFRAVKLPQRIERDDADGWFTYKGGRVGGGAAEWYNKALEDVGSEITAAGIKWEAE